MAKNKNDDHQNMDIDHDPTPTSNGEGDTVNSTKEEKPKAEDAEESSKKGLKILLVIIGFLLAYHLVSDRYTPYTNQARIYANIVSLAPELSGRVKVMSVKDNNYVEKGQALLEIDKAQYIIALRKAEADLTATRREVEVGDAGVDAARANLSVAEAELERADKEKIRHAQLYEKDPGAISLRRVEVSQANYKKAQSRVEAAKAQIVQAERARGSLDNDNDRVEAAQAAVSKAQLDLKRTILRAPGDGVITNLAIDAGQYASPGQPIMTFIAVNDVWISADMTENNLGHIESNDSVDVTFDMMPGRIFNARVRSVSYGVNTKKQANPGQLSDTENSKDFLRQAQRFPVIIELANPEHQPDFKKLKIGGQADVIVYTKDGWITNWVGYIYIRLMSYLSYLY